MNIQRFSHSLKIKDGTKMENKYGIEPTAELITHTQRPIETIFCLWHKSKDKNFNMTPMDVEARMVWDDKFHDDVIDLFRKVIAQQIPVGENIWFTFMLHNDPISHREQMVRHRIGVHFGDNFGVDIIPDQQKSTWWSQSMRIMDYKNFVESGNFFVPESIQNSQHNLEIYIETLKTIQQGYKLLVENGIPMQDARNLLPLGTTMHISWSINLSGLMHIIGKRSCWILQYGLWSYIIKSMIKELETIHPIFRELSLPPCFVNGEFTECVFKHENERRVEGQDDLPVCPLYYTHEMNTAEKVQYSNTAKKEMIVMMDDLAPKYSELWNRDAWTGEALSATNE